MTASSDPLESTKKATCPQCGSDSPELFWQANPQGKCTAYDHHSWHDEERMAEKMVKVPETSTILRQWIISVPEGSMEITCPSPLAASSVEDVLAMMDLVRKQIERNRKQENL